MISTVVTDKIGRFQDLMKRRGEIHECHERVNALAETSVTLQEHYAADRQNLSAARQAELGAEFSQANLNHLNEWSRLIGETLTINRELLEIANEYGDTELIGALHTDIALNERVQADLRQSLAELV